MRDDFRLWLIRHGETAHNIDGVFQGQLDTPLNARGHEQARQTGIALAPLGFSRIYSSDLARAADTARAVAGPLGIQINFDPRLRELHYGVLQGVRYGDFREVLAQHGMEGDWGPGVFSQQGMAAPGGESLDDLLSRLEAFVGELIETADSASDVAVVAHGGTLRTLLTTFLGMPATSRDKLAMSNCGVSRVHYAGGRWRLEFHNRVYWDTSATDGRDA
ncbi:MAG: histidine phosphatase family protein [Geminicoccales bacterium]